VVSKDDVIAGRTQFRIAIGAHVIQASMTKHRWGTAFVLLVAAFAAEANHFKPASCTAPVRYRGEPLYRERIELPAPNFALGKSFDPKTRQRLDQGLLDAMKQSKVHAMTAALATSKGLWHTTRTVDRSAPPQRFYWASVGKAFTATVIMQLAQEGKLSLNDKLSRWLPQFPNASVITVDHLLHHTAGVANANEDPSARDPDRETLDEVIAISARHGTMFCPGERLRYSNTGFDVLGKIIERVDKRPYHEAVNARIGRRLNLASLRALAPNERSPGLAPLAMKDGTKLPIEPGWGFAAAGVVGSADDMLRFWHALLTGRLLNAKNTARLFEQLYPMADEGLYYGRGVQVYVLTNGRNGNGTWLGHSGGTTGAKAMVAYVPAQRAFIAVALSGEGSATASARVLLKQLGANP
jgi:D-alanyl-D-alanine carboxypeptidase